MAAAATRMAEKKKRSPLLVRLPLIIAVGFGFWLWKGGGGLLITERQLVFRMPSDRADLKRFEWQLYSPEGALLKSEDLAFTSMGAPAELTAKVQLKQGPYSLKVFRWYEADPIGASLNVAVADDEKVFFDVPSR